MEFYYNTYMLKDAYTIICQAYTKICTNCMNNYYLNYSTDAYFVRSKSKTQFPRFLNNKSI